MANGLVSQLGKIGSEDITDGTVIASEIGAQAVTAAKHKFVGTGSPTGYGLSVQTGSWVATTGIVTTQFGTAFGAAPFVVVSLLSSGAAATQPGMVTGQSAGSFTALGENTLVYSYMAIGSGNI